jgi:rhodanese-related sulfurtransferase
MQKRSLLLAGGAAALLAVAAVGWANTDDDQSDVMLVTATGAELEADESTLLVDIRTPEEWEQTGVIDGALLVTYTDADSFLAAIEPHLKPGQSLSLICRSGNRTSRAARQIAGKTKVSVRDVAGGMIRVVREGYQPVSASRGIACTTC